MRRRLTALALFMAFLVAGAMPAVQGRLPWSGEAFGAFYCAGQAIAAGKNPYTVEPLRSCERRVWQTAPLPPGVVEPAPLPGYALAPFVVLSRMPYLWAGALFGTLSLAALVLAAYLLTELSELPLILTFSTLGILGGINMFYGEIPPIAVGFLCIAATCVVAGRDRLAALACTGAMIEPHMALAASIALFLWRRRARRTLLAAGTACVLLSGILLGPKVALSYLTEVLALHARAEIPAEDQYSLTWLAHFFGASDTLALALGSGSFLILLVVGVMNARRVAERFNAPSLLVFFPTAMTTLFGSFIHDLQMIAAMPAALIIAGAVGMSEFIAWVPVFVLSVSWQSWWFTRPLTAASAVVFIGIGACMPGARSLIRRELRILALLVSLYAARVMITHLPKDLPLAHASSVWPPVASVADDASASLNWGAYVHAASRPVEASPQLLAAKSLVWFSLFLLVGGALRKVSPKGT